MARRKPTPDIFKQWTFLEVKKRLCRRDCLAQLEPEEEYLLYSSSAYGPVLLLLHFHLLVSPDRGGVKFSDMCQSDRHPS